MANPKAEVIGMSCSHAEAERTPSAVSLDDDKVLTGLAARVPVHATLTPASLNGEPVDSVPIRVPVTFQLAPE